MATPVLVTVTGHIEGRGSIAFVRHRSLTSAIDDTVIPPPSNPVVATLDSNGDFSVQLYATNDPDWLPLDWAYSVSVRSGAGTRGSMQLDYQTPSVDLDDVLMVAVPAAQGQLYVPFSELGQPGGIATLGQDGVLAANQRAPLTAASRQDLRIFTGPTPPANPANGDIWFDTSGA